MYGKSLRNRINGVAYRRRVKNLVEQELATLYDDLEVAVETEIMRAAKDIVPAVLGMRRHFGEWELDTVNGKRTPVSVELVSCAEGVALKIVSEAIKDYEPPKAMLTAIRSAYRDALLRACEETAVIIALEHASEWGVDFVNETLAAMDGGET